ncbi:PLP-dependent aminotransferase family protein [Acidovorax sp. SDU_ACID1]|uniref:PLP-dependent aminotransferase family protein n=1 Tax=Acidovorax sp. SDU_ACID1 TaxID=3136632 RepID=UPI0038739F16
MTRSRTKTGTRAGMGDSATRARSLVNRLSSEVLRRIHEGALPVGTRLPSVRGYAKECGVSNETVLRVYDNLVALGYLEARRGAGFFVVRNRIESDTPRAAWSGNLRPDEAWLRVLFESGADSTGLGSGLLPADWLDQPAIGKALQTLSAGPAQFLSGYADPGGYWPLREQLRLKLHEQGIPAKSSQIITTAGATDALHLTIWANFFPRNYVLAEDPGPFLQIQRILAGGMEVMRVPRLEDGPDLEALQAACEKHKPRAFFCSSVMQNPTSTSLTPYKAHQVLKIAEAHDLLIIDDDTYGDLLPPAAAGSVGRLAALDQLDRVIHIGSFSKTVAPGLRSGFLAASPRQIERILLYRTVGAIHGTPLTDLLMHHLLASGRYRSHCEAVRTRLDAARGPVQDALAALGCRIAPMASGMYLWASLGPGVDALAVSRKLAPLGIQTAPGPVFSRAPEHTSHMRFNVAFAETSTDWAKPLAEAIEASRMPSP